MFFKKLDEILSSVPATMVGGIFLLLSFFMPRFGISFVFDPAWITVIIGGIPLILSAVDRSVHSKGISKISSAHLICIATIAAIFIGDLFAAGEVVVYHGDWRNFRKQDYKSCKKRSKKSY